MAPNLQHVFVTLQGIEASPGSAGEEENSTAWQELAPELTRDPLQVDLLAPSASSCRRGPTWRANIPANQYRQVRLRLAANSPDAGIPVPARNQCGNAGNHCVVTASGEVRPLIFGGAALELQIAAGQIAEGGFRVLPDTETNLAIEFQSFASMAAPAGKAVKIAPVFFVAPAAACESSPAAEISAHSP
jgi:uncharacterized protein DUF4382